MVSCSITHLHYDAPPPRKTNRKQPNLWLLKIQLTGPCPPLQLFVLTKAVRKNTCTPPPPQRFGHALFVCKNDVSQVKAASQHLSDMFRKRKLLLFFYLLES